MPTPASNEGGTDEDRDASEALRPSWAARIHKESIRAATRLAASGELAIVLEGESGTGKSRLAGYLHLVSPRRGGPFESVNLAAIDDSLASSELFGHERGAFTDAKMRRVGAFARAHHGTLFIDELGKASRSTQQKLLLAVETKQFRPLGAENTHIVELGIIGASNVPLDELLLQHGFLPDLYARLEAGRVRLPSLRERREEIPHLVAEMLRVAVHRPATPQPFPQVDDSLMRVLIDAYWPFNIRQLQTHVRRILLEADGAQTLSLRHYPAELQAAAREPHGTRTRGALTVEAALELTKGNKTRAAEALGVDRTTLYRHLRREQGKDERDARM